MSFVKLLIGILFMTAILFFAVMNLEETVDLKLWPDAAHLYRDVPVVVALLFAYLLGIITYFVIALARDIRLRARLGALRKENRSLLEEVHHLRGSSLDDLPTAEAPPGRNQKG